ncbi:ferritin-like domain-containing protein [Sphingomonas montana]|uniref:ferritin-like domain-containing protein n=1 Tax=Sphingomonas montana TaxID=1843236 RepID=UPI00096D27C4|nr:ferritin-like domain-containing protein [Sphingomonas montana]
MNSEKMIEALDLRVKRRGERREFFKMAGSAAVVLGGASLLSACGGSSNPAGTPTPTPTPAPVGATVPDQDILNFALNLEYLEAQFYSYAAFGTGLDASLTGGIGGTGVVTGGRKVTFTDPLVAAYALEIAQDEINHVRFLRSVIGTATVGQPALDISASATGAFSSAARAAGLITGAGSLFDPYATDENFLLGAFIFEDVGVSAYKGAASLISNKTFTEAAAGILAAEAYHAGLIRTVLYRKGLATPSLIAATESISNARDSLDGATDIDQGIRAIGTASNIVPTDANGLAFSRTTGQVLNIVYLTRAAASSGGFFPSGLNGTIRTSTAN